MRLSLFRDFYLYAAELLESNKFRNLEKYMQHGRITCFKHSIGVALLSLMLVRFLKIKCDERALVRGALLHDYFLYDWHEKGASHGLHGFTHAKAALSNADRDFVLNDIEREIIKKHMWPLNLTMPMCREAWVVNLVDTYCSLLETVGRYRFFSFLEPKVVKVKL
jgi:Predicted HD superfamily hydrolase